MKKKSLHEIAVRLCEGGCVNFFGHFIRAKVVIGEWACCQYCEMDSICDNHFAELCAECDSLTHQRHILYLACSAA